MKRMNYWNDQRVLDSFHRCYLSVGNWQRGICEQTKKGYTCLSDNCHHGIANAGAYSYAYRHRKQGLLKRLKKLAKKNVAALKDSTNASLITTKANGYWTKTKIRQSARSCDSRKQWRNRYYQAWFMAGELGIRDACCKHMSKKPSLKERVIYALKVEQDIYIGLTYNSLVRFNQHKRQYYYNWLKKKYGEEAIVFEVLDGPYPPKEARRREKEVMQEQVDCGMNLLNRGPGGGLGGGSSSKKTKATVMAQVTEYLRMTDEPTRKEFKAIYGNGRKVAERDGFLEEFDALIPLAREQWSIKKVIATTESYSNFKEWKVGEKKAYSAMMRLGLTATIKGILPESKIRWTIEKVIATTEGYTDYTDWRKAEKLACKAMRRLGIEEDIEKILSRTHTPNGTWTEDEVISTTHVHDDYKSWKKQNPKAYRASGKQRLNILAKIHHLFDEKLDVKN